jgi:RNA recognition motif-containing protein
MNIYVGNLPFGTSEDDLRQIFEAYGEVSSAKIITDRLSGKSRGFGFVEMPNQDEAQAALDQLNGSDMDGRALTVSEARPREGGGGGRGGRGGGGGYRGGGGRDRDRGPRY